jgi:hypothetical protein
MCTYEGSVKNPPALTGNVMEGMNLLKVTCTHIWDYHNAVPLCYQCILTQK